MHIQILLPEEFYATPGKFFTTPGKFFWQKKSEYAWNHDDISRCFRGHTDRQDMRKGGRLVPRNHLEISS